MSETNYLLGQKVFQSIQDDILSGRYQREEELREIAIGEELRVSRTPVREALRQLELDGLVKIIPNRGAYVVGISLEDMKEIYELRCILEKLCAKWAVKNAALEQIEGMEEVIYLTQYHINKGHMKQMAGLDGKFHEILYEAGGSRILEQTLKNYHRYLIRVRRNSLLNPERAKEANKEHRQILEALKERDEEKAENAASLHMIHAIKNIDSYGWENITGGHKNGKN